MNRRQEASKIRKTILDVAATIVTKDRNIEHGDPEDNFTVIANLWNAFLANKPGARPVHFTLSPTDVALMMALMKIARLQGNLRHTDSWIDLAGYAACGAGIATLPDAANDGKAENTITN